jgi:1-acylglycerone phosphate reductase
LPTDILTRCSEGGAGNSLALEFASQGCRVFATARSLKSISNLSAAGIEVFTLDVTSQESIDELKAEITNLTNGKLDVLYNNAGVRKSYILRFSVSLYPHT